MQPLTYGDCFNVWTSAKTEDKIDVVKQLIIDHYNIQDHDEPKLINICKLVCATLKTKWEKCSRSKTYLLKKESGFLASQISVPEELKCMASTSSGIQFRGRGRPEKPFEECTEKNKKRKVEPLVKSFSTEELRLAADISASSTSSDPLVKKQELSLQQTLALCLDLDLSERKYNLLRTVVNNLHPNTFPSLYKLNQYKTQCLSAISSISDTSVEVDIQDMLHKTVNSIFELSDREYIQNCNSTNLTLVCKWGMDGSSSHSMYKQTFLQETDTDEFLFFCLLIIIITSDPLLTYHRKITSKTEASRADDSIKQYFLVSQDEKDPLSPYNITSSLEDTDDESESE